MYDNPLRSDLVSSLCIASGLVETHLYQAISKKTTRKFGCCPFHLLLMQGNQVLPPPEDTEGNSLEIPGSPL
uniref:Uncharacterized protein n=1 Tax=Picea glauca TaxID=3330 RepID=A0A117NG41_PICGL|nr:hypothetical protein ABT39_MTgene1964 [Picea glauca]QHR91841.1 hypothetical protein Q903MT_gene5877 [Picea sitchensis]